MKKIAALLLLLSHCVFSQSPDLNKLLPEIAAEKNDSIRFYLAFSALTVSETNPVLDMHNAEVILVHGQKNNDKVCQVLGFACLGYDYRAFGDTSKSLKYNLKANAVAETSKDDRLLVLSNLGLATNYLDLVDYPKAIAYSRLALKSAAKVEVNLFTIMSNLTMGEIYLAAGKTDLALRYTQKAYELSTSSGIKDYVGAIYGQMGRIHDKLGNPTLALNYMKLGLAEAKKIDSPKFINLSYNAIAEHYLAQKKTDSAKIYAQRAIAAVRHSPFETMVIAPSDLLTGIYKDTNVDSAFAYSQMNKVATDSLFNFKTMQQTQLMTFEENARQQELALEKARLDEERLENIQYAFISLGIITLIILILLLSRSFIANTRVIEFLGVIALLIVFEFFNLLLHPFIGGMTHHSPVFMLLAMVCLAALLVPLHHKAEHWATKKLVEKNKEIRLKKARRTIEQLEHEN